MRDFEPAPSPRPWQLPFWLGHKPPAEPALAGRDLGRPVGSNVGDGGISYTGPEYDYALDHDIPVLAFLHKMCRRYRPKRRPRTVCGIAGCSWVKVSASERHTVDFWTRANELARKVGSAIPKVIRTEPPRGWIRGGEPTKEADRPRSVLIPPRLATADDVRETTIALGAIALIERAIYDAAVIANGSSSAGEQLYAESN